MKLNDDQRKVMQALLDGKNVAVRLFNDSAWEVLRVGQLPYIGDGETQYRIEEPAIKVALFGWKDDITPMSEEESLNYTWEGWVRISDWVEIVPNLLVPTRSDE